MFSKSVKCPDAKGGVEIGNTSTASAQISPSKNGLAATRTFLCAGFSYTIQLTVRWSSGLQTVVFIFNAVGEIKTIWQSPNLGFNDMGCWCRPSRL